RRLEHAENTADPVVCLLRRTAPSQDRNQASSAPRVPPHQQPVPHPINVRSAEESGIRLLYYRRLRLGFVVGAIALLSLWFLRFGDFDFLNDSDSFRTPGRFLFAVLCLYACAIAAHLWLRPMVSLARLRQLAVLFFGLFTVALGYRQYAYLAFLVPGGPGG